MKRDEGAVPFPPQRGEGACARHHSTRSTYTLIRPPQDKPACQAVSSATPNSKVRGLPSAMTSSASVITAPSTQPPETEPRNEPSPSMARWLPTGRGAEPQVSTTVASATSRPERHQASASRRMSVSVESIMRSSSSQTRAARSGTVRNIEWGHRNAMPPERRAPYSSSSSGGALRQPEDLVPGRQLVGKDANAQGVLGSPLR